MCCTSIHRRISQAPNSFSLGRQRWHRRHRRPLFSATVSSGLLPFRPARPAIPSMSERRHAQYPRRAVQPSAPSSTVAAATSYPEPPWAPRLQRRDRDRQSHRCRERHYRPRPWVADRSRRDVGDHSQRRHRIRLLRRHRQQYDGVQQWCAGGLIRRPCRSTTISVAVGNRSSSGGTDLGARCQAAPVRLRPRQRRSTSRARKWSKAAARPSARRSPGGLAGVAWRCDGEWHSHQRRRHLEVVRLHAEQLCRGQWCTLEDFIRRQCHRHDYRQQRRHTGAAQRCDGERRVTKFVGGIFENGSGYTLSNYFVSNGATLEIGPGGTAVGLTIRWHRYRSGWCHGLLHIGGGSPRKCLRRGHRHNTRLDNFF